MPLEDRATNILARLTAEGIGKERPVVFITHSLGGLVIKKVLQQAMTHQNPEWKPIGQQMRGVVFLATPHTGADAAIIHYLDTLRQVLRLTVSIDDLRANAPALRELNIWYRNNAKAPQIRHQVYYEKHSIRGLPLVVDESSADFGSQGVFAIPVDADHLTICKPRTREELVYKEVHTFVAQRLEEAGDPALSTLIDLSSGQLPPHLDCMAEPLLSELGPLSPQLDREVRTARGANQYSSPDVERFAFESELLSRFADPPSLTLPGGINAKALIYVLDQREGACRIVKNPSAFHTGGSIAFDPDRIQGKVRIVYFVLPLDKAAYEYFRGNGLKHLIERKKP
jgi:hypothetical protein